MLTGDSPLTSATELLYGATGDKTIAAARQASSCADEDSRHLVERL